MSGICDSCCSSRDKNTRVNKEAKIDFDKTYCERCTTYLKERREIKKTAKSGKTYFYFCSIECYNDWLQDPRPAFYIL